jgi:deoxyribonuclease (pyrimidine dimer)
LRTKTPQEIMKSIPKKFTLNSGHVLFFYNKMKFLYDRFFRLVGEMERRGYSPDLSRANAFIGFDPMWYGNWESTTEDDNIVLERIKLRISEKPYLYNDSNRLDSSWETIV